MAAAALVVTLVGGSVVCNRSQSEVVSDSATLVNSADLLGDWSDRELATEVDDPTDWSISSKLLHTDW